MKGICTSKRLLFIYILSLLWLPNYCDIKQNEADSQSIQNPTAIPSDLGGIKHVPSEQEKENYVEELVIPVRKADVQPNVEYVNSVEKEGEVDKEHVTKFSQHDKSHEETAQHSIANLESSRLNSINVKDDILPRKSPELSEKPNFFTSMPTIIEPELIKPSQAAPNIEPSVINRPLEKVPKPVESTPNSVSSEPPQVDAKKEAMKLPHQIPLNFELRKHGLEENIHQQPHYDGMPSFDEWKKMMLAEQQKGGQKMPSPSPPGKKISSQKRRRNYSSFECGAKIVASNAEADGASRILNELVDEYMLNPCKAKIWFVIELCETVQASQIELANFELFSSCPKEFAVYSSDNFPTRDWVLLGVFNAAEQRVLQSFELKQEGFGKFIKIELLSHYGKEHYCPLSVVRIFGTSMVDEYEEMETLSSHPEISEDDLDRLDISLEDKKSTNIFGSATDAVMNIMKKAAQALGQHQTLEDGQNNETIPEQQNVSKTKLCSMVDNASENCEDVSLTVRKDNLPTLYNFSIAPSSMHKSLFRLLHRCDQCASSRIRYYSSAQPHCRFFQAAFGPVVFQSLCDWLKEHPLVFAHESSAHRKKDSSLSDSLIPSPTKSPPPQIMVVPLENDSPLKKLLVNVSHSTINSLSKSLMINATKTLPSDTSMISSVTNGIQLEPSIQPTHTQQTLDTVAFNDSKQVLTSVESGEIPLPSAEIVIELPQKPTISLQEDMNLKVDNIATETIPIDISITDSSTISEVFSDADEEQMREFLLDPSSVTFEDVAFSEMVLPSDLPSGVKNEDKPSDMHSEMQGKLEPVTVSSGSTGQKESVFMRMSNRIKSLELNMSLSSQYLQELSQRYRRQMEEMQQAFNRTIGTLNDTAKKAAERDLKQQDILNTLQLQVSNLTGTVEFLLSERSSMFRKMVETHVCLMVIEAIIMITVMSLCVRRISSSAGQMPEINREVQVATPRISKRRSSADSIAPPVARKVKKRSASEEALNAGEELLIVEPSPAFLEPILKDKYCLLACGKKKNRKRSKVQRSASNPTIEPRNPIPTSRCIAKRVSYTERSITKSIASKQFPHRKNHTCENCNDNICTDRKNNNRDQKLKKTPFQNLTNGTVLCSQKQPVINQRLEKGRDRFSFMKFLKFQRRDSI
ncbi:SUN domain-containing ossification factor [Caerostris extrusa]|uniref:SUN domain-containing ossification factor n=1 Tax=Caerostris extrusa TaxID=172846 RepID=A0AAV4QK07_CAEEX|nr:SUN domain-containing ossification factor [Caerostris extrusa]